MKTLNLPPAVLVNDPVFRQRSPFQFFIMGWSVVVALPLLGGDVGSATLERELNHLTLLIWGGALLLGSLLGLAGEFWPGRTWTALELERYGCVFVGLAGAYYALVLVFSAPDVDAIRYVVGVQLAYVTSLAWRVGQITKRLRWIDSVREEYHTASERG